MEITLLKGDITKFKADVTVTAANSYLSGGGGVDGAVHRAAGPQLITALSQFKGCKTGDAVITEGFNLDSKYIIHAVGPIYNDGKSGEEKYLYSAYEKSILLASTVNANSILFPAISAGVYGYPLESALKIAVNAISNTCKEHKINIEVSFVCFDEVTFNTMTAILKTGERTFIF